MREQRVITVTRYEWYVKKETNHVEFLRAYQDAVREVAKLKKLPEGSELYDSDLWVTADDENVIWYFTTEEE